MPWNGVKVQRKVVLGRLLQEVGLTMMKLTVDRESWAMADVMWL